jgi:hypothetical protein
MPAKKAAASAPKKAASSPAHASYKGTSQRFIAHNAFGLLRKMRFPGRVALLMPFCRYDQRGYPQCKCIHFAPRRFVSGRWSTSCSHFDRVATRHASKAIVLMIWIVTNMSFPSAQRQNWQQVRYYAHLPSFDFPRSHSSSGASQLT